jgi:hypothetical protein
MGLRADAYDCRVATFFEKSHDSPVWRAVDPRGSFFIPGSRSTSFKNTEAIEKAGRNTD